MEEATKVVHFACFFAERRFRFLVVVLVGGVVVVVDVSLFFFNVKLAEVVVVEF